MHATIAVPTARPAATLPQLAIYLRADRMAATLEELQRSGVRTSLYRDVDWGRIVDDLERYPHHALIILYLAEPTYGHYVCLLRRGDALELFILVAVAFRFGAVERQDAALLQIARDLEAKTVAFQARRKGWGRRLGPEWSRRGTAEFVRDV